MCWMPELSEACMGGPSAKSGCLLAVMKMKALGERMCLVLTGSLLG